MNNQQDVLLEDVSCPLGCPKKDEVILTGRDLIHNLPGEFTVVKCCQCGLIRTNPRPTPDTIGMYYPSNYAPYQVSGDVTASTNDSPKLPPSASYLKQIIKRILRQKIIPFLKLETRVLPPIACGQLLEVGCANGAYLLQMQQQGWKVAGIEFSESAAKLAHDKGLAVQVATVESATAPAEQVDIVAAWMVLEHLHDPVNALKKIKAWVKPDGYLVASVPDANSFVWNSFGNLSYNLQLPNHLYHFTPNTLSNLLNYCGWELSRVVWQRNCNTLLWSAEYTARDKKCGRLEHIIRWIRTSEQAGRLRLFLSWILGVTKQSGRIEIWAKPINNSTST